MIDKIRADRIRNVVTQIEHGVVPHAFLKQVCRGLEEDVRTFTKEVLSVEA